MGITERKRLGVERESMMKQLEHQKAKLLDALRLMPAGVIVAVKPPEKTTLANGLAQKILRSIPHPMDALVDYASFPMFRHGGRPYDKMGMLLMRSLMRGEAVSNEEIYLTLGDGSPE